MKKPNIRKWLDGFPLAGKGILLAMHEKRFVISFIITFLFFGTLMNLLSGGLSKFQLMGALGFPTNLRILGDAFLGVFGSRLAICISYRDPARNLNRLGCVALEEKTE